MPLKHTTPSFRSRRGIRGPAIDRVPREAQHELGLATEAYMDGNLGRAVKHLKETVRLAPRVPDAYQVRDAPQA